MLAHNLIRWANTIATVTAELITGATTRRKLITPARITHSGRRHTLHFPTNWPWKTRFIATLVQLRSVQLAI